MVSANLAKLTNPSAPGAHAVTDNKPWDPLDETHILTRTSKLNTPFLASITHNEAELSALRNKVFVPGTHESSATASANPSHIPPSFALAALRHKAKLPGTQDSSAQEQGRLAREAQEQLAQSLVMSNPTQRATPSPTVFDAWTILAHNAGNPTRRPTTPPKLAAIREKVVHSVNGMLGKIKIQKSLESESNSHPKKKKKTNHLNGLLAMIKPVDGDKARPSQVSAFSVDDKFDPSLESSTKLAKAISGRKSSTKTQGLVASILRSRSTEPLTPAGINPSHTHPASPLTKTQELVASILRSRSKEPPTPAGTNPSHTPLASALTKTQELVASVLGRKARLKGTLGTFSAASANPSHIPRASGLAFLAQPVSVNTKFPTPGPSPSRTPTPAPTHFVFRPRTQTPTQVPTKKKKTHLNSLLAMIAQKRAGGGKASPLLSVPVLTKQSRASVPTPRQVWAATTAGVGGWMPSSPVPTPNARLDLLRKQVMNSMSVVNAVEKGEAEDPRATQALKNLGTQERFDIAVLGHSRVQDTLLAKYSAAGAGTDVEASTWANELPDQVPTAKPTRRPTQNKDESLLSYELRMFRKHIMKKKNVESGCVLNQFDECASPPVRGWHHG
jgi:hypothetical protein